MFPRRTDRAGKDPQLSAGPVHGVRGRSRWLFEPDMSAGGAGDILAKAITVLNVERNGDRGRVQM